MEYRHRVHHTASVVVGVYPLILAGTEFGIILAYQRAIDGLSCGVRLGFRISSGADKHHREDLPGQFRDELTDDIVLRVYEVRRQLRAVGHHLVAHEVQQRVAVVAALCNLHHAAFLHRACHLLEDAVRNGPYGCGRFHHNVLHHADIHIAVGTHQLLVTAGRDVFIDIHGVVEGTLSATRPYDVERGGIVA